MKIAKIELFKVAPRWLFLKMTTASSVGASRSARARRIRSSPRFGSWARS